MKIIWRLPFTCGLGLLAAAIVAAVLAFDLELIYVQFFVRSQGQATWVDDCLAALALVVIGCLVDGALARRKAAEIQAQRLRVLEATMLTVHDIVNNFLNGLQLVQMEAEALPADAVELLDRLSRETSARLKMLGDLESVPEIRSPIGIGIDYGQDRLVKS